jgi:two-component system sensor histidine kinase MtrB
VARVAAVLGQVLRGITFAWRRSVQARVVISTLVLGSLVVALVGWLLLRSVGEGLVEDKANASVAQAEAGFREARLTLTPAVLTAGASESEALTSLVEELAIRGGNARTYEVVLTGPLDQAAGGIGRGSRTSPEVDSSSVPANLRGEVESGAGTYWTYTELTYQTDRPAVPAVAVGSQLQVPSTGEVYALYYLFPMDEQEQTLSLLARSLAVAALALLVLVASVAWLVTRQVVAPVRLARRIAERLAAGRLEERVHVAGEDDIARLGVSFNQMAASLQKQIREFEELSWLQRRFVSDVSHELRTPLTTVRMAADVLHDAKHRFDPVTARSAELLQAELDRFEALLSDLLEISRFDAGAAGLEVDTVDLKEIAERVVASSQPLAELASVRLSVVDLGSPGGRLVEADVGGSNASCATWSATRSTTASPPTSRCVWPPTRQPSRSPCATSVSVSSPARTRWSSTGSGVPTPLGCGSAVAAVSAWRSRARTLRCTGAGWRLGASPAAAHSSGSRCPAGWKSRGWSRRSRWCRVTPCHRGRRLARRPCPIRRR